jgi:hypothetical protein
MAKNVLKILPTIYTTKFIFNRQTISATDHLQALEADFLLLLSHCKELLDRNYEDS